MTNTEVKSHILKCKLRLRNHNPQYSDIHRCIDSRKLHFLRHTTVFIICGSYQGKKVPNPHSSCICGHYKMCVGVLVPQYLCM